MALPLESILNSLEDAVLCLDDQLTVLWLNEPAAQRFACDRRQATGQPAAALPALADIVRQLDLPKLSASGARRSVGRVHLPGPGADPVAFEATVSPLQHDAPRLFLVTFRDVTRLLQMERTVYESRKAQALAALADGIAHDFNNVLTAVISQLDLAMDSPEFPAALRDHLIYAQTSARRGAELVSRLQIFGHRAKSEFGPVNVAELLEQAIFVLKRSIDPKITLSCAGPAQTPWLAMADATQITQAILNLAINARDAMPQGGQLTFELANQSFQAPGLQPPRKPGDYVQLTVKDTGHGMSAEVASRVFEPYFTTKDQSRAPGLGLSITSAIITEHAGWMELESQPGTGSTFSIFLPRALDAPANLTSTTPRALAQPRPAEANECVLLVDDEELVRLVTKAVLAYRGYRVIEAEDGQEAVEKYAANPRSIDLVLMDMHMPKLNGYDALLRIRQINPKARVILLSGGVHEPEQGISQLEGAAFLHKPFENQELVRLVRQMLDSR